MQHKQIIGLMNGNIPLTKKTVSYLSDVIEKYPYFQAAHILHTLNLLQLKDAHFLIDLRKTAIYAPDRKQLFFRIEDVFFDPKLMDALNNETLSSDSPFELIDTFLLGNTEENADRQKDEIESLPISTDYASYLLSNETENGEAPPLQHQDAIDKFLEKDAVSPLKINLEQTDVQEEEESSESLSESTSDDSFFSETLAKIYVKQKKYDKALEIIRKLNLIYPEKNRYFADQIRFLEKLIINTNKIK